VCNATVVAHPSIDSLLNASLKLAASELNVGGRRGTASYRPKDRLADRLLKIAFAGDASECASAGQ
jgi:hypothetical protein